MTKKGSIRLNWETIQKLKDLYIEVWWKVLTTYQEKVDQLLIYYSSHINNNK